MFPAFFLVTLGSLNLSPIASGQGEFDEDTRANSHRKIGESAPVDTTDLQQKLLKNFQDMKQEDRDRFLRIFQGQDPEELKDPESFDPKQRKAIQDMMRKLMNKEAQESPDNPDSSSTPDDDRRPQGTQQPEPQNDGMPPHIKKMLRDLQQPQREGGTSPLEELMDDPDLQSFARDLTRGLNSETRDGQAAFPWLNDPRFPQDLMNMRKKKSFFDDFTRKIAKNDSINNLLKEGLKWRRENNESRRRNSGNGSSSSSNSPDTPNPATPEGQGSQSPTVLQRISNLSPSQASNEGGLGWSLPKLPLFFAFSGPNVGHQSVPSFHVDRPSAPSFDPTIFFFVLLAMFAIAVVGLVFGSRLQSRVGEWIERGQNRLRPRRGWPTPPEQMTSNDDLVQNILHLNSKLYPHRLWNHRELRAQLERSHPASAREIQDLSRDFERAYYRESEGALQAQKLKEHGRTLRELGANRNAPS